MTANEPLIPKHGGYRRLKSFQVAQLVFDITVGLQLLDPLLEPACGEPIRISGPSPATPVRSRESLQRSSSS
jgi:hypothetical protein